IESSIRLLARRGSSSLKGVRSHYWSVDWDNTFASWTRMHSAGLAYDMSLSPMQLGYRNGSALPMLPLLGADDIPKPFTATSTNVMDYYTISREMGVRQSVLDAKLASMIISIQRHRGALVLDWHVRTFANVGRWQGYLGSLLEIVMPLTDNSSW